EGDESPAQQLRAIRTRVETLVERQERVLHEELLPALEQAGIRVRDARDLPPEGLEQVRGYFAEKVFPVLTPLAVDPSHPFPYVSHLSLNLAVTIRNPETGIERFARVKVPPLLPRLVPLQDGSFVLLEQVIELHLGDLFPGMDIVAHYPFRVTRDNDLDVDNNDAEDLLATVQSELLRQRRGAFAVRLEVTPRMTADVRDLLCREMELAEGDVYECRGPLDLSGFGELTDLDRRDLKLPSWTPVVPRQLRGVNSSAFFSLLRGGDFLVEHPYESFQASVESFVRHAASDPWVLAIKQTLYRTSTASPIALALERAAADGKQVVALVEVKARGDEQANIDWAQRLEKAGVHVVYGLVGLKTHAKLVLVVRQEPDGIRRYVHVATGNYNPKTAAIYEDIGLLSSDPELGADVSELFNVLTGYSRQTEYRELMVAPTTLRKGILRLIEEEAQSDDGRIVLKTNNLVDPEIIDRLYDASQRGVQIDLLVRSICCLRPGVPGLSENIRVRSLVGRFLEHSRIFRFGNGSRGVRYYIGSADMMERNLDRRVEAVVPVKDPALRKRLDEVLELELQDDSLSWTLDDSTWSKVPQEHGLNAQDRLCQLAAERAGRGLTSGA
ncbi:MAG: polyphosphate kinase 1, partial [Candidatus Dormibacteraeota bacterium]|nr:polyphosphate kinase 1 [Candidatus Dormibacteraeota bacterium]